MSSHHEGMYDHENQENVRNHHDTGMNHCTTNNYTATNHMSTTVSSNTCSNYMYKNATSNKYGDYQKNPLGNNNSSKSVPLSMHNWTKSENHANSLINKNDDANTVVSSLTQNSIDGNNSIFSRRSSNSVLRRMKKGTGLLKWRVNKAACDTSVSSRSQMTSAQQFFQQSRELNAAESRDHYCDVKNSKADDIVNLDVEGEDCVALMKDELEQETCRRALQFMPQSEADSFPAQPVPSVTQSKSHSSSIITQNHRNKNCSDFGIFFEELKHDLNSDHSEVS